MSLQATLATRAVERRSLIKRQRVVCASSAKGATMRIVATEFGAVVGISGKSTRGIAVTGMTDIDRPAIGHNFSVYVCSTTRTGGQNRHFPAESRSSGIEQRKEFGSIGEVDCNAGRLTTLQRDVATARATPPRLG